MWGGSIKIDYIDYMLNYRYILSSYGNEHTFECANYAKAYYK